MCAGNKKISGVERAEQQGIWGVADQQATHLLKEGLKGSGRDLDFDSESLEAFSKAGDSGNPISLS